ncbi:MAG TPA: glycosyltransferase family 4 protein [Bryobacteraceae bacterium]|nr:glycosyltransferase family 4 protein [Bryobacteraceae bacterium]
MRILLISDYATPTGGAELMVLALRDALRRRGHDARLFASSARPLDQASQADYQCFGITSRLRGLIQVVNPSAYWGLQRVLRDFQPDVAHVRLFLSQLSPAILPLLEDVPAIHHVAWYRSICPIGTKMLPTGASCHEPAGAACWRNHCFPSYAWPSAMLQMKLFKQWRTAFNVVVANSYATKRRLAAEGVPCAEVVWNGVPVRPLRCPLSEPPMVVFAGRLLWEKGADVLLNAFSQVVKRFPSAQLLIAGDGPERPNLVSQLNRLRLQSSVRWLGHISREDLEREFAHAWVQVVSSRWEEPFGLTAAEALMRGTAVVATDTGGLAEFVRHNETGILVPPQDPNALADALCSLLGNRELAHCMGLKGRAFALEHLTEDTFVDRFVGLYELLCQRRGVATAQ